MSEYRVESFDLESFPSLKQLFKSSFGVNVNIETFKKKYATANIGGKAINYVAIYNQTNEIVSHFAALPVKIFVNGETIISAQSSDAMTDEGHGKKGLFKLLAATVHEECRTRGIKLLFSQPNKSSYHSFTDVFNFQHIDNIIRWDLKLKFKTAPLGKLLISSSLKNLYLKYCGLILKKYKIAPPRFFTNSLTTNDARILRDKSYIEYKNSPDKHFIQINDVLLWIKLTDVFWIGEIDQYNNVNFKVLKKLKQLAFLLGYNTISFHLNEKVLDPGFLKHFKKYNSEPSTIYYLDKKYSNFNLILTGADFDTW